MYAIDKLGSELALAFACVAAVGSSMVRRFRIEDAKSCTRVCRRILSCAATPPPSEVTNNLWTLACLDAVTTAATLLTRRLCPLYDIDTTYLSIAEAAIASLRHDLTSGAAVVLQST
jgi:hypothetical protein